MLEKEVTAWMKMQAKKTREGQETPGLANAIQLTIQYPGTKALFDARRFILSPLRSSSERD